MHTIIKKLGTIITSRIFYLILGIFLAAGFAAYATWDDARTGGSGQLTEANWNELVTMIENAVGVSSGFCVFSKTEAGCPVGWTRDASFDGRTIRGDLTPGGTGGSESHTHTVDIWASDKTGTILSEGFVNRVRIKTGGSVISSWGTELLENNPQKGKRETTAGASSWAPYMNVIVCCKD